MFERPKRDTKDDDSNYPAFQSREPAASPESRPRVREAAVIGPSIQINGDLSGEEDLIIQGKVQGTIQLKEKSLTVGTKGKVDANVLAHAIIVEGQVNGDLYGSESVAIRKTGNVNGNIVSPRVGLEEGCRFKGSIDMDEETVSKAFGKTTSPSPKKVESAPVSSKPPELPGQSKPETTVAGSTPIKSSSIG